MEPPKIIYVQAHGGGSERLDNKFMSLNQYRKSIGNVPVDTITPYIIRIVSPGKSALSDFESDRVNVNFLVTMLTDKKTREHFLNLPNTREFSGAYSKKMEGARGFGELLTSTSLFSSNDMIYNEIVEVELEKRSGLIHSGEGGEEDPGGFGIFVYNGDWEKDNRLSSILVDSQQNSKDISILDIANYIVEIEGPNVVIIFPNCSPFSDASYTDATNRAMWTRIKTAQGKLKRQIDPRSQFKMALEIVTRVKNFFEGQKRFSQFISSDDISSMSSSNGSGESKKMKAEDRIGVIGGDDFTLIFQLFLYFFKDYYNWLQISPELMSPELHYILSTETMPENINIVKFIMALLLLVFRVQEKHGGIMYEDKDKKKGRMYVWNQIIRQSGYGPRGRGPEENYRKDDVLRQATQEQTELLEFIERANSQIEEVNPAIPRYTNFEMLVQYALDFATIPTKGGRKRRKSRKRKTRKKRKSRKRRKTRRKRKSRKRRKSCRKRKSKKK
tara:strand:+ start:3157 stop:4659 length:1503 start_codon:yes stop_codon:yes gene_type:complete